MGNNNRNKVSQASPASPDELIFRRGRGALQPCLTHRRRKVPARAGRICAESSCLNRNTQLRLQFPKTHINCSECVFLAARPSPSVAAQRRSIALPATTLNARQQAAASGSSRGADQALVERSQSHVCSLLRSDGLEGESAGESRAICCRTPAAPHSPITVGAEDKNIFSTMVRVEQKMSA